MTRKVKGENAKTGVSCCYWTVSSSCSLSKEHFLKHPQPLFTEAKISDIYSPDIQCLLYTPLVNSDRMWLWGTSIKAIQTTYFKTAEDISNRNTKSSYFRLRLYIYIFAVYTCIYSLGMEHSKKLELLSYMKMTIIFENVWDHNQFLAKNVTLKTGMIYHAVKKNKCISENFVLRWICPLLFGINLIVLGNTFFRDCI